MSAFQFNTGHGKVSTKERNRIDAALAGTGISFSNPTIPGDGPRYWFESTNLGTASQQASVATVDRIVGRVATIYGR